MFVWVMTNVSLFARMHARAHCAAPPVLWGTNVGACFFLDLCFRGAQVIAVGYASYRTYLRKKLVRHLASRRKCLDACWALLSRDGVVTLDTWLRLCAKHKDVVKQKQVRCPLPPPPATPRAAGGTCMRPPALGTSQVLGFSV